MTGFQVFLMILGFVIIALSYFVSEKITHKNDSNGFDKEDRNLTTEEEKNIREQIQKILKDQMDESLAETEDSLRHISNEKIMTISEYSDAVIEKITQNHTEVVFLYNMLNEKEAMIKTNYKNNIVSKKDEPIKTSIEPTKEKSAIRRAQQPNLKAAIIEENIMSVEDQKVKNDKILKLHAEGKSILEISKLLEIGQGEVKLVIDISQGVKK